MDRLVRTFTQSRPNRNIQVFGQSISSSDFRSLLCIENTNSSHPNGFIGDSIVNAFFSYLNKQCSTSVHGERVLWESSFFPSILKSRLRTKELKRYVLALRHKEEHTHQWLSTDRCPFMGFPMHTSNHWSLVMVDFRSCLVIVYDSLEEPDSVLTLDVLEYKKDLEPKYQELLEMFHNLELFLKEWTNSSAASSSIETQWMLIVTGQLEFQKDYDCALFTIMCATHINNILSSESPTATNEQGLNFCIDLIRHWPTRSPYLIHLINNTNTTKDDNRKSFSDIMKPRKLREAMAMFLYERSSDTQHDKMTTKWMGQANNDCIMVEGFDRILEQWLTDRTTRKRKCASGENTVSYSVHRVGTKVHIGNKLCFVDIVYTKRLIWKSSKYDLNQCQLKKRKTILHNSYEQKCSVRLRSINQQCWDDWEKLNKSNVRQFFQDEKSVFAYYDDARQQFETSLRSGGPLWKSLENESDIFEYEPKLDGQCLPLCILVEDTVEAREQFMSAMYFFIARLNMEGNVLNHIKMVFLLHCRDSESFLQNCTYMKSKDDSPCFINRPMFDGALDRKHNHRYLLSCLSDVCTYVHWLHSDSSKQGGNGRRDKVALFSVTDIDSIRTVVFGDDSRIDGEEPMFVYYGSKTAYSGKGKKSWPQRLIRKLSTGRNSEVSCLALYVC